MSRPATSRLKVNPPLGMMPALQYAPPSILQVDQSYQRSLENKSSQTLIRKIAQYWNWDLCQPLVVARRHGGSLFVIDGQHRLEAAKLRGDIQQLPCVIVEYASSADEAASFVHLNQQRRPLSTVDVFKAAVASLDPEAVALSDAMADAGLTLAGHSNYISWKPGMVANIGGLQQCWRERGRKVTSEAMTVLAQAFPGAVLQYGGTIFPGIAAVVHRGQDYDRARLLEILGRHPQVEWRNAMLRHIGANPEVKKRDAMVQVLMAAWRGQELPKGETPAPVFAVAQGDGRIWCDQCDRAVTTAFADACRSRFCSLRKAA